MSAALRIAFVGFVSLIAIDHRADGGIISFGVNSNINNTTRITVDANVFTVSKEYLEIGDISVDVEVDGLGRYDFEETILNSTGANWSGFRWTLTGSSAFFLSLTGFNAPFTDFDSSSREFSIFAGSLSPSESFTPSIQVVTSRATSFTLIQTPVVEAEAVAPEPASFTIFGLGAIGMTGMGMRRKRKQSK